MDKKLYDVCDFAGIEAVIYADTTKPKNILGAHICTEGLLINMYMPNAKSVVTVLNDSSKEYAMEKVDEAGFFAVLIDNAKKVPKNYSYVVTFEDGREKKMLDMYAFDCFVSQEDIKKFESGVCCDVYDMLGAHLKEIDKIKGTYFTVWAPNAQGVRIVGDFNNYDGCAYLMNEIDDTGIFELFVPDALRGAKYKFELHLKGGEITQKCDPYAFKTEKDTFMSVVTDLRKHNWLDEEWMENRKNIDVDTMPMFIYEIHLDTFLKGINTYKTLAPIIANYVRNMGYTHIELLPIMEYENDESLGYDTIGYYAPTSRYGRAFDFMYFVEYMHMSGIGVILDWVPSFFSNYSSGLKNFDGTRLYEYVDNTKAVHPVCKKCVFDYEKNQVRNFLLSNVSFWLDMYHIDGLRVVDVSSMLYLDYARNNEEWHPNACGSNENLEAVKFIRKMNKLVEKRNDGSIVIAEETSLWKKVTEHISDEGLGFDYKWNVEWTKDILDYMMCDPLFRKGRHGQLTDGMLYFYSERFMITLSHNIYDKFKDSLFNRFPGEDAQVYANMKALLTYLVMYPGKKLIFMGLDFAYREKWSYNRPIEENIIDDLIVLQDTKSIMFNLFMKELINLYKGNKALYYCDYLKEGFEWINDMDIERSIISFCRSTDVKEENLLVVCNFTPVVYEGYVLGVVYEGKYIEIFNSDCKEFGGEGYINDKAISAKKGECDGRNYYINIIVPPMAVTVFKIEGL